MIEFDELLNQVISEDANAGPPSGMESRLHAALSVKAEPIRAPRRIWLEVAAAALLIGLSATWMHRYSRATPPAKSPAEQALANSPAVEKMPGSGQESSVPPAQLRGKRTSTLLSTVSSERPPQIGAIQVAPLKVERLVIPSIEIAFLTPTNSNNKEEVR